MKAVPDSFTAGELRDHIAILGMTGSGKTSTGKLAIEQVAMHGARVCILDPSKSDWWGITSMADGKKAALPFVIMGGPHGHVPLHSGAGAAIGKIVAANELKLSIIDMADFEPGGLQRFFIDFAETLYKRNKGVVHLVIEEAHEFAPKERSGIGAENMAIHWAKKLATGSRTKGIRLMVASQRVQNLHNALLGSCGTIVVHRLIAPADQEPVMKWVKSNVKDKATVKAIADDLSDLEDGEAYVISRGMPVVLKQFPRIQTFDNTKTPDGQEIPVDAVKTASMDKEALKAIIGAAILEAHRDDPKTLKARIAELEAQIGAPATADPSEQLRLGEAHDIGYSEGWEACRKAIVESDRQAWIAGYDAGAKAGQEQAGFQMDIYVDWMKAELVKFGEKLDARPKLPPVGIPAPPANVDFKIAVHTPKRERLDFLDAHREPAVEARARLALAHVKAEGARHEYDPDRPINPPAAGVQQKILDSLAELEDLGSIAPSRDIIAALAGYTSTDTKSFKNAIGAMRTAGLIDYPSAGSVAMCPAARRFANPRPRPRSDAEHQGRIFSLLGGKQMEAIIKPLLVNGEMTRDRLAEYAGYTSVDTKSFKNALGRMRTLGFVDYPRQGYVTATKAMWL